MTASKTRLLVNVVFLTCFFLTLGIFTLSIESIERPLVDFGWYYYAFHVVLSHKTPSLLYNIVAEKEYLTHVLQYKHLAVDSQYAYPPQFAVLLSFLGHFRYGTSEIIWECLSVITYIASLTWLQSVVYHGSRVSVRLLLIAIGLIYYPYFSDILNGNSDWLVFSLLALSFAFFHKERRFTGGLIVGAAAVLKVTPVFILIYFAAKRDLRALSGMLICAGVLTVFSGTVLGWNVIFLYARSILHLGSTSMKYGAAPWNSSIIGVLSSTFHHFHHTLSPSLSHLVFLIYAFVMLASFLFLVMRQSKDFREQLATAPILVLCLSPLIEAHYLLLLLFPIFVLIGEQFEHRELRSQQQRPAFKSNTSAIIVSTIVVIAFTLPGWLFTNIFPAEIFLAIHVVILVVYLWVYRRNTGPLMDDAVLHSQIIATKPLEMENEVLS